VIHSWCENQQFGEDQRNQSIKACDFSTTQTLKKLQNIIEHKDNNTIFVVVYHVFVFDIVDWLIQ